MARQVYFDPFGSYINAYDKGVGRQMELESNRRQARAQDFDYNFMLPFRFKTAQRDDIVGAHGLEARKQMIDLGLETARYNNAVTGLGAYKQFGLALGAPVDPTIGLYNRLTGYTGDYNGNAYQFRDAAGNVVGGAGDMPRTWQEYVTREPFVQDRDFNLRQTGQLFNQGIAAGQLDLNSQVQAANIAEANRQHQLNVWGYTNGVLGNPPRTNQNPFDFGTNAGAVWGVGAGLGGQPTQRQNRADPIWYLRQ